MKKIIFSLVMIALVAFSCKKEKTEAPTLKLSKNTIEVSNEASEQSISITTNQKTWNATSNADWVSVSQEGTTLKLSIKENTTSDARKAEVTITASTLSEKITINQTGVKLSLEVDPTKLEIEGNAASYTFAVKTNVKDWTVECPSPWVTVTALKDKNEVKFDVTENKSKDVREANIVVKDATGTISANFTVSQKSGIYILPLLDIEATISVVDKFEKSRNSTKKADWPNGVAYETTNDFFYQIQYMFNPKTKGLERIYFLTDGNEFLDKNFIALLKSEGFSLKGQAYEKYDIYEKSGKTSKGEDFVIAATIIPENEQGESFVQFQFISAQPTFETMPLGCIDFEAKEDDIKDWESKNNGTFSQKVGNNLLFFDVKDSKNSIINRIYNLRKTGTIYECAVIISDPSKVYYGTTDEFTKEFVGLLEKEEYAFVGEKTSAGLVYQVFKNEKLNILVGFQQAEFEDFNNGNVVVNMRIWKIGTELK